MTHFGMIDYISFRNERYEYSRKRRSVPRGADHIFLENFSIFLETPPFCKAFYIYKIGGERDVGTTKNLMTKIDLNL